MSSPEKDYKDNPYIKSLNALYNTIPVYKQFDYIKDYFFLLETFMKMHDGRLRLIEHPSEPVVDEESNISEQIGEYLEEIKQDIDNIIAGNRTVESAQSTICLSIEQIDALLLTITTKQLLTQQKRVVTKIDIQTLVHNIEHQGSPIVAVSGHSPGKTKWYPDDYPTKLIIIAWLKERDIEVEEQ